MPISTCANCGKTFTQKGHYDRHCDPERKRPCVAVPAHVQAARVAQQLANTIEVAQTTLTRVQVAPVAAEVAPRPVLKWVGGKTQILGDVLATFPAVMNNYHEPFVGGGSVLLALLAEKRAGTRTITGTVFASDLNANLIGLYKAIQSDPEGLIAATRALVVEFGRATTGSTATVNRKPTTLAEALTSPESYYFWTRARFNGPSERTQGVVGPAMLLFLNKTCFRGVYREGPHGFNVPFGNYTNPTILEDEHIRATSDLLRGVEFTVAPFAASFERVVAGDFVYADPPYAPEVASSFVGYTADGFNSAAHDQLFALCAGLKDRGVGFTMSNAAVARVLDAFPAPAYTTRTIQCRRAINSKKPGAQTNEVLITGGAA